MPAGPGILEPRLFFKSIRLFGIETTQFDSEGAVNSVLIELPGARDGGALDETMETGVLQRLTSNASQVKPPTGQGSVPGDQAQTTNPCLPPRTEEMSFPGSKDLELTQALCHMRAGGATAEEQEAWNDFCTIENRKILAIIRRSDECKLDAEDLAQRVWCIVAERLPTFPFDPALGTLGSWVRAIARRQAGGHVRRRARHREETLTQELAATLVDPDAGPSVQFATSEQRVELRDHRGSGGNLAGPLSSDPFHALARRIAVGEHRLRAGLERGFSVGRSAQSQPNSPRPPAPRGIWIGPRKMKKYFGISAGWTGLAPIHI